MTCAARSIRSGARRQSSGSSGLDDHGLEWIEPPIQVAHPLDDGRAALVRREIDTTDASFERRGRRARVHAMDAGRSPPDWDLIVRELLGPLPVGAVRHPVALGRFGLPALLPMGALARRFRSAPSQGAARRLRGPLLPAADSTPFTGGTGLALLVAVMPWAGRSRAVARSASSMRLPPVLRDGGGRITTGSRCATCARCRTIGRRCSTSRRGRCSSSPEGGSAACTPRSSVVTATGRLPSSSISCWTDRSRGATRSWRMRARCTWVARYEEIVGCRGDRASRPRPSSTVRAADAAVASSIRPERRTAGTSSGRTATCRMAGPATRPRRSSPSSSASRPASATASWRSTCCDRRTSRPTTPTTSAATSTAGSSAPAQFFTRPAVRWDPYSTPDPAIFVCSSSTPPGGGVHGLCGGHAARSALRGVLGLRRSAA